MPNLSERVRGRGAKCRHAVVHPRSRLSITQLSLLTLLLLIARPRQHRQPVNRHTRVSQEMAQDRDNLLTISIYEHVNAHFARESVEARLGHEMLGVGSRVKQKTSTEEIVATFPVIALVRTITVERCVPIRKGQTRVEKWRRGQEARLTIVDLATPAMLVEACPTDIRDRRVQSLQRSVDHTARNAGRPICRRVSVGRVDLRVQGQAVVP